jgi:hypothetical protein
VTKEWINVIAGTKVFQKCSVKLITVKAGRNENYNFPVRVKGLAISRNLINRSQGKL